MPELEYILCYSMGYILVALPHLLYVIPKLSPPCSQWYVQCIEESPPDMAIIPLACSNQAVIALFIPFGF